MTPMLRPTGLRADAGRALGAAAAGRFARDFAALAARPAGRLVRFARDFAALAGRFDLDRLLTPDPRALDFGRDPGFPDFRLADADDRFIFLGLRDLDPLPGRFPAIRTPLCETNEHTLRWGHSKWT
ncbi:MAG TPA: hypothetical protein VK527_07075 [Candidatus Limnocylindrales bacterium]|jgi:hypothetical protein|nr:hypothetical protein [Candidatus Limnocylindrales bacterium]